MKSCNKLLFVLVTLCSVLPAILLAQTVDTAWVRRYNGPGNSNDGTSSLAVDGQGNVYVTGYSAGSGTSDDYTTIKYNSNGDTLWVRRYNGPGNGNDGTSSLAVDGQGNVYVTGYSAGSGTSDDYATIKYNSNGDTLWVRRYNGPGNSSDYAFSLAVDVQGNVYVTGNCIDSSTGNNYYATIKYNSAGETLWVRRYSGTPHAIAVDNMGNVYVTGRNYGGSATANDYATIKYYSNGDTAWVRRYDGPEHGDGWDEAFAIAVDNFDNVYITGTSMDYGENGDYATVKYNSAGVQQWVQRYNGSASDWDEAYAIAVDSLANVYVTGYSGGSGTHSDYATIKYNSAGQQQWVQRYNGPGNNWDQASSIALDNSGNVYVTGQSYGSGDSNDYATIKYNSSGVQQWVIRYNGPSNRNDIATAMALDSEGNIYVTGQSYGLGTSYDYTTIKYVQTLPGVEERTTLDAIRTTLEVYPNPVCLGRMIRVRVPLNSSLLNASRLTLKLYDVSGKLVKEIASPTARNDKFAELRVSLKGMTPGIYFIQAGDEIINKKLIITK